MSLVMQILDLELLVLTILNLEYWKCLQVQVKIVVPKWKFFLALMQKHSVISISLAIIILKNLVISNLVIQCLYVVIQWCYIDTIQNLYRYIYNYILQPCWILSWSSTAKWIYHPLLKKYDSWSLRSTDSVKVG